MQLDTSAWKVILLGQGLGHGNRTHLFHNDASETVRQKDERPVVRLTGAKHS